MEEALDIACCGTYDEGNDLANRVIRVKAIRLAGMHYRMLARRATGCGCTRCEVEQARRSETEP